MRTRTEICDHEGKNYSKDYYRFSPNVKSVAEMELKMGLLSPSIHKFDNEFIQPSTELGRRPQDLVLPSAMRHVDALMSSRSGRME
jgi:hypothetical protein